MVARNEIQSMNENDLTMEDIESGLSIRDEDEYVPNDFGQNDLEVGDIDAFVITKDALVSM